MAGSEKKLYRQGLLKLEQMRETPKIFFVEHFGFHNFLHDDIFTWLDILADNGVNGVRVFGFWPFARGVEQEPFEKTGDHYNLNRFNKPYFEHLQKWVSYAQEKGIFVLFELFDSWGLTNSRFCKYHPFYQVSGNNLYAFSDITNRSLVNLQKRYAARVIEALRPNLNVILGVMNAFKGEKHWHYEISGYLKIVAPEYLVAGSDEESPAAADPSVDIWFIQAGRYNVDSGESDIWGDVEDLRKVAGEQKIIGFSTSGLGAKGKRRENPADMSLLARDAVNAGVPLLGFLDHGGYNSAGKGDVGKLNIETYRAIAKVFQPSPQPQKSPQENLLRQGRPGSNTSVLVEDGQFHQAGSSVLPEGYFDIFQAARLPSSHAGAFVEHGGKAIRATSQQGFLCYGQYRQGYPLTPLRAVFTLMIDNNSRDDQYVLILDVYDHHSDRVQGKTLVTRKDFPRANGFSLFSLDFTPPSPEANMEFRIYYMGHANILASTIVVFDPSKVSIRGTTDASLLDGQQRSLFSGAGADASMLSEKVSTSNKRRLRELRPKSSSSGRRR